ncbi:MAG: single-stranded-DNA-specific exonuclease RecJ [Clostridiales bacterium]|nr:single-stranded-DNA-specific exonuclease RecJ [Clostridiales bacterium]
MTNWLLRRTDADVHLMMKTLRVSETMARSLANRGIRSKNAAIRYLAPRLDFLPDALLMKDMDKAVDIAARAIRSGEPIMVYGDYDADGVMSSVILIKTLRGLGANANFYIPKRKEEGYGLNLDAVRLISQTAKLLITCDNGIAAINEIREAKSLGLKVIVIDHHQPGFVKAEADADTAIMDILPCADAIVDPKQQACAYPFKQMCAAGICYRFSHELYTRLDEGCAMCDEFLALAAIATECDIVPLKEDNRVIVRAGLNVINNNKEINTGLYALLIAKGLEKKVISTFDIGFIIGPCINASGRLSQATLAVNLFITSDLAESERIANELAELNERRKVMTSKAVERVEQKLKEQTLSESMPLDKVLVLFDEDVDESVAGIVAGRVKELVYRPVLMFTPSDDLIKASCRSIEAYNMFDALYKHRGMFIRFGGHAMAAGLSMRPGDLAALRKCLNDECELSDGDLIPSIRIDKELNLEEATYELARELSFLAPFGNDNPQPLFGVKNLTPESLRMIDDKRTMIFSFRAGESNRRIKGICFGLNDHFKEMLREFCDEYEIMKICGGVLRGANFVMDCVYALEINDYNYNITVQMDIKDIRLRAKE